MATLEQLKEYFEKYVLQFQPYKNENLYKILMQYLIDVYYNEVYGNIPNNVVEYLENQVVVPEFHDKILTAIGLPNNIIDNMGLRDKKVFLESFADFVKYKGSIKFIQRLAPSFSNRLIIAELYLDYDIQNTRWILRPRKVYSDTTVSNIDLAVLDYLTVYNSVPHLLIDPTALDELYSTASIILPLKTNILYIYNQNITELSLLNNLIYTVFLAEYQSVNIQVYFQDYSTTVSLLFLNKLWYYLLMRYFNSDFDNIGSPITCPWLSIDNLMLPSINDLNQILTEYNNIQSRAALDSFFQQYIVPLTDTVECTSSTITIDSIYQALMLENQPLTEYVVDRIESVAVNNQPDEITSILNEIYISLILSQYNTTDQNYIDYLDYYLANLTQIFVNVDQSTFNTLLVNLKPYHVDLFYETGNLIMVKDKFNQVFIDSDDFAIMQQLVVADALELLDPATMNIKINSVNQLQIISTYQLISTVTNNTTFVLNDLVDKIASTTNELSTLTMTASVTIQQKATNSSALPLISFGKVYEAVAQLMQLTLNTHKYIVNSSYNVNTILPYQSLPTPNPIHFQSSAIPIITAYDIRVN